MHNPFEVLAARLESIEEILLDMKRATRRTDDQAHAPHAVLNVDEAAALTGFAKSTIYKMTSGGTMPHSKRGKKLYFDRQEIEAWLLQERQTTKSDIERLATEQLTRAARGRG